MISVSGSQSKIGACGGRVLPAERIALPTEGALPFRCDRLLSITARSSMQAMFLP